MDHGGGGVVVGGNRRVTAAAMGAVLLLALLGGCSPGSQDGAGAGGIQDVAQQRLAQGMVDAFQPSLIVNPPDGAAGVSPTERVTAVVASGHLTEVDLRTQNGTKISGALSPDGQRWTSTKPLKPDTPYLLTVTVRATSGKQATSTSRFSTWSPGQQMTAKITPIDGATIAEDQPVRIVFDKPVSDRAAVERALRITSYPAVTGSTQWRGGRELLWRPSPAWPPGSRVTVGLDIFGKQLGLGLFGAADVRTAFRVAGSDRALAAGASRSARPGLGPSAAVPNARGQARTPRRTGTVGPPAAARSRSGAGATATQRPSTRTRQPSSTGGRLSEASARRPVGE